MPPPDRTRTVDVVIAHNERVTLRVGDVFLKVDADPARADREVAAMALAPIPTPEVRWRQPPVLALAALPGRPLGRPGRPESGSSAAWSATGATIRSLHDAPLPPWSGQNAEALADRLELAGRWLVDEGVLPSELVARHQRVAAAALRAWRPVFIHGDLHDAHVFISGDDVSGIIDWSEAGPGDAAYDLACLTLAHPERLGDLLAGYGETVDRGLIRSWWSARCLMAVPWLIRHGFDPAPELSVLRDAGPG